jgi:phenylalanyl-tRNA synthetase beta chain
MKFSERWLRDWVNPPITTDELAAQFSMSGLEVDAVEPIAENFTGVVVGEIVSVAPHPNADKLRVCQVNVGEAEPLNIVCGAPVVEQGWRVPTALVGAQLPGGLKIKQAKLRGVESAGMLCAAKELGISESAGGLMYLPSDAKPGEDFRAYLDLDDVSIELDLTPNRGDCLGMAGIAREVGVLNKCPVTPPAIDEMPAIIKDALQVHIDAPADCPRYVGRVIKGINVNVDTPLWMSERLRRSGIRSLGPVVDVTNYVLLELGQPMHAFDLDKLQGGINVRKAKKGEKIILLDGQEVTLDAQTLVIADHKRAQAMAGIMGGAASAVGDGTVNIFLESAFFAPESISGRARSYGLHTDSSHRFERGVDPQLQRNAIERATALLLDIVGGEAGPVVDVSSEEHLPKPEPITLRKERIRRMLGIKISDKQVRDILNRLEMKVTDIEQGWTVTPPSFRSDITLEVDLIEELARIYGYNNIPSSKPVARVAAQASLEAKVSMNECREVLINRGYQEAITYSFVDRVLQTRLNPDTQAIAVANPISADMSDMRTTLWTGLVQASVHNVNRQQNRVRLFESGLRFSRQGSEIKQQNTLSGILSGPVDPENWAAPTRSVDFFDCKADVQALLDLTRSGQVFEISPATHPALHPGQSAAIKLRDQVVGYLGALHPSLEQDLDFPSQVFVFEVDFAAIEQGSVAKFQPLSQFPSIRRDIAIVIEDTISFSQVRECVYSVAPDTLQNLQLFDVYKGKGIDSGRKSLALGLTFQDLKRTLNDIDVDTAIKGIIASLDKKLGATLRS